MVASLLAVLLTVPGSVWAVLVAQDQLNQSEEAGVKEERAQASRVSAWTSQDPHGKWLVHLMNRSPDPIAHVYLTFEPLTIDAPQAAWNVLVMSVPPCTDMTVSQDQLMYLDKGRPYADFPEFHMPLALPPKGKGLRALDRVRAYMSFGVAVFTDRNGVQWIRKEGRLSRLEGGIPVLGGYQGLVFGQPTYRTIKECGGDTEG
ncbi:hypothetical protein ACFV8Z_53325 [Streptomyces sp. NPDC059837]|uniref:hypothetical protein n=1 Tax=unclassified Streptomyces TaxID=2593676 RepID=UPI003668727A